MIRGDTATIAGTFEMIADVVLPAAPDPSEIEQHLALDLGNGYPHDLPPPCLLGMYAPLPSDKSGVEGEAGDFGLQGFSRRLLFASLLTKIPLGHTRHIFHSCGCIEADSIPTSLHTCE